MTGGRTLKMNGTRIILITFWARLQICWSLYLEFIPLFDTRNIYQNIFCLEYQLNSSGLLSIPRCTIIFYNLRVVGAIYFLYFAIGWRKHFTYITVRIRRCPFTLYESWKETTIRTTQSSRVCARGYLAVAR